MPDPLIQSSLLASVPGLRHGFHSNHTEEGRAVLARVEPTVATVKQVHRDQLAWAAQLEKRARDADAIATAAPDLSVGVYSADCTPILVAALDANDQPLAVMAVHAGWRGTALGIAGKAFADFHGRLAGQGPLSFKAAIGPCIQFESFEVGAEVVEAFPGSLERGLARFLREEGDQKKFLFDLSGENERQLRDAAAQASASLEIDRLRHCTLREREVFPSYRRDRERAGRLLSYLSFGLSLSR